MKVFSQTPLNPGRPPEVGAHPAGPHDDRSGPHCRPARGGVRGNLGDRRWHASSTAESASQPTTVTGADEHFTDIMGGELVAGPLVHPGGATSRCESSSSWTNPTRAGSSGDSIRLGKTIRVGGSPAEVIGLYAPAKNIFTPPGADNGAIVPYGMIDDQFDIDKTNALFIPVKPRPGVSVAAAEEAVTVALREMRHLRPADRNTFDLITQDQILDLFGQLTGAFFLVMVSLSSVALLVGGIGVMAIMMVSVTSRTREIGVRKALGATRRDIMLQFLTEAATLTGLGGIIGVATGLLLGRILSMRDRDPRVHSAESDGDRGCRLGEHRSDLRSHSGTPRGAARPGGGPALRVAPNGSRDRSRSRTA